VAVLALGLVGAAIAPAGYAAVGWAIGSLAGQFLFQKKPPDQQVFGPRLGDTRVQASTYGTGIPVIDGTARAAGNIIWTNGIQERVSQSSEEVGGKGGGGQTVTTTTYTYDVDLAIGICVGEIIGVRKIWANSTLIYNVGDTADTATIIASNQSAQNIKFYLGTESQLPDSTIEAALGAGNVPGYRGLAYAVFTQLQLANFGNAIPNLEFEVVATGSTADLAKALVWDNISLSGVTEMVWNGAEVVACCNQNSAPELDFFNAANGTPIGTVPQYTNAQFGRWPDSTYVPVCVAHDRSRNFWTAGTSKINGVNGTYLVRFATTGVPDRIIYVSASTSQVPDREFRIDANDNAYFRVGGGSIIFRIKDITQIPEWDGASTSTSHVESYVIGVGSGYGPAYYGADGLVHWLDRTNGIYITALDGGTTSVSITGFNTAANFNGLRWDLSGRPWVSWTVATPNPHPELKRFDPSTGAIEQSIVLADGATLADFIFAHDGYLWINTGTWRKCLASDGSTVANVSGSSTSEMGISTSYAVYSAIITAATADLFLLEPLPRLTATDGTTVQDAVERICEDAGYAPGEIDASSLTDTLYGYVRGHPMTARSAIELLARAFFFDAVESDNLVKFVKRGVASPVTIDEDELAYTGDEIPVLRYVRADELGAPRQLTVNFWNRTADYMDAAEYARRLVTRAREQTFEDFPIAMSPTEAARVADVLLYNSHAERTRYVWSTGPKFAAYEPTDTFSITSGNITHVLRAATKVENGLRIDWEGVSDHQAGYTSAAAGATDQVGQDVIGVGGPTLLALLDIPILRDIDDDPGFYAAMSGTFDGWDGAVLHGSTDGTSYTPLGSVVTSATQGYATTVLGNFSGGNVFDDLNSVTVTFNAGTPASASQLDVLNGANLAIVGSELIQFTTATLSSGTTYVLSGLLRGRRGTEQFMASHAIGDRVILISTSSGLIRASGTTSELNVAKFYKAPAIGSSLELAAATSFTNTGAGLKPLSPVYLRGFRDASNDITITWIRRGRISWDWNSLSDIPLGEDSESYEVDILNVLNVVLRTISTSSQSATYTSAQQTTDFGSPQSSVSVRVYQISATVGRGFAATGTI
jgi:hypothetical protein